MTQARAAEAAGVTEVTVRNRCKSLRKILRVQPGRTQRKRRPSWSELEATQSSGAEVPLKVSRMTERTSPSENSSVGDSGRFHSPKRIEYLSES